MKIIGSLFKTEDKTHCWVTAEFTVYLKWLQMHFLVSFSFIFALRFLRIDKVSSTQLVNLKLKKETSETTII